MKLVTEVSCTTQEEVEYFPLLEMEVAPGGLLVRAKSPAFAAWIKGSEIQRKEGSPPKTWTFQGKSFYYPTEKWSYDIPRVFAGYGGSQPYFADDRANLFWLFSTELEEGFEVLMPNPISLNNLEDYFTSSCQQIQALWSKDLRRVVLSARFKEVLK